MGTISDLRDKVSRFYLGNGSVRGRLVRLGSELNKILEKHVYPSIINQYIAELAALAAALAVDSKFEGVFTLQIVKGSIINMIVIDITTEGDIRACAKWDQEALNSLSKETDSLPSFRQLFDKGYIIFAADLANSVERYQAIVELEGNNLTDCIHHFFRQSDQIQTGLVLVNNSDDVSEQYKSGALIIQKLPDLSNSYDEENDKILDDWFLSLSILGTVTKKELLNPHLPADKLLYQLFHEQKIHLLSEYLLTAKCSCKEEKIKNILDDFSNEDLESMIIENNIIVTCEFCNTIYKFSKENFENIVKFN